MRRKLILVALLFILLLLLLGVFVKLKQKTIPRSFTDQRPKPINITLPQTRLIKSIKTIPVVKDVEQVDWSWKNDLIALGIKGDDDYSDIYTMKADGSNQICLTCAKSAVPQLNNSNPAWHPSGDWIVFQAQDPNLPKLPGLLSGGGAGLNNNLWVVSADGKRFGQLTHVKFAGGTLHSRFSNDGKRLFWAERIVDQESKGHWVLKIADFAVGGNGPSLTNEKTYTPLNNPDAFYESHGFTRDDSKIIFSANPEGGKTQIYTDLDIYSLDLTSEKLTNLTNSPNVWDELATVSPSGKKIVWENTQGYTVTSHITQQWLTIKTDLWIMNSDGSGKQRITYFNDPSYPEYTGQKVLTGDPSWNKDGAKLLVKLISAPEGIEDFKTLLKVTRAQLVVIEFREPQ